MTEPATDSTSRSDRTGVELVVEGMRALGHDRFPATVMQLITSAAAASTQGAAAAGLTVSTGKRFATMAPTGDLPGTVDTLQYLHGGPCVDAIQTAEAVIVVDDLRTDPRWPTFADRATTDTPVLSMLSLRLYVHHERPIGSLNLYATKPHAFGADTVRAGEGFAAYAAVALANAMALDQIGNLEVALHSSREIGAATGVLMSRHLVTRDQAFELLRVASQDTHRKVRDLAEDVLATGELPAPPVRPTPAREPGQPAS